jgi:hypothetical protein
VALTQTNEIARCGRYRLVLIVALLALLGLVVSHHGPMPEGAHGMEMGAICLAVLGGGLGLALCLAQATRRPRPVSHPGPCTVVLRPPVAVALPRAGPELRTVVLRR